eukprot:693570-Pyramimonas_sp.AAC.1
MIYHAEPDRYYKAILDGNYDGLNRLRHGSHNLATIEDGSLALDIEVDADSQPAGAPRPRPPLSIRDRDERAETASAGGSGRRKNPGSEFDWEEDVLRSPSPSDRGNPGPGPASQGDRVEGGGPPGSPAPPDPAPASPGPPTPRSRDGGVRGDCSPHAPDSLLLSPPAGAAATPAREPPSQGSDAGGGFEIDADLMERIND